METYHTSIFGKSGTDGGSGVLIQIKPPNFESEDFGKHGLSDPFGQVFPHVAEAIMLPNIRKQWHHEETQKGERVDPRPRRYLLMIRVKIQKYRGPHRECVYRLNGTENHRIQTPQNGMLPLGNAQRHQSPDWWCCHLLPFPHIIIMITEYRGTY